MTISVGLGTLRCMQQTTTYTDGSVSIPVTMIVLLLASTIFTFGVLYARWHRQRADYKALKAGVPGARKAKWALFRRTVKVGFFVFIAAVIMITWVGRDIRAKDANESKPLPSKVAPSSRR